MQMCLRVFEELKEASVSGAGGAGGKEKGERRGGASLYRTSQAMVRTLAFISNEMGAMGGFWAEEGHLLLTFYRISELTKLTERSKSRSLRWLGTNVLSQARDDGDSGTQRTYC